MASKNKSPKQANTLNNYFTDNRTPCKYGTDCFRTNPDHRKQFKHEKLSKTDEKATPKNEKEQKATESPPLNTSNSSPQSNSKTEETPTQHSKTPTSSPESSPKIRRTPTQQKSPNISHTKQSNNDISQLIFEIFCTKVSEDFFNFWKFCKEIYPSDPKRALTKTLGLMLVGPYEVLAGVDRDKIKISTWRYYYDVPEFQTILASEIPDENLHHIGYYHDVPSEVPVFVASNTPGPSRAVNSCKIVPMGDNIFAAVCAEIENKLQSTKKRKRDSDVPHLSELEGLQDSLVTFLAENNLNYSLGKESLQKKKRKVVASCFHGAGISVPIDNNDVGYRELPETNSNLKKMLAKVGTSDSALDSIQELVTLVQFANDECDYGMGLELGHDLLSQGNPLLHPFVMTLLPMAYELLGRREFGDIVKNHIENRSKLRGAKHWKV